MFGYRQEFMPPEVMEGAYLEGQRSLFSVVVPEATENLITNPSPVMNTTGYSATAGAIASSTTRQRRGPNSIRVAPTAATADGAYFGTVTTVTGWNTFSLDFWGYPGVPYKIYFATTGAALLGTAVEFVGEGLWRRPEVKLYEAAGTTRRVYFTKNGSVDTNYFYVDGLQVEAKDHSTTFCMGDMVGFVPNQTAYYWTGIYYGSTSVRIADTGSGGKIVPLSDYNFRLLAHTGLGMSEAINISFPYARVDGENYQTTRMAGRSFSIMGTITGDNYSDLMRNKGALTNVLHPNRTPTRQSMLLLYQYIDEYGGNVSEDIYRIKCSYIDGMKGSITNKHQERIGLNFRMDNPIISLDGLFGSSLNYQTSVANTAHMASRINGAWQAWNNGAHVDGVYKLGVDLVRGRVWIAGLTSVNGITLNKIGYFDIATQTFIAIGGATVGVAGGDVINFVIAKNGDVWVLGTFTSAGGSNTDGIARWNTSSDTFTCFDLSAGACFYCGVEDSNGNFYFGGYFTNWNGDGAQDYITKYTTAGAWAAVGTSPFTANNYPFAMTADINNNIYIGEFKVGAISSHVRKRTSSAWVDLGGTEATAGIQIFCLYIDSDGILYIGGNFSQFGGINASCIVQYNGSSFSPLSGGSLGSTTEVRRISSYENGTLLIAGFIYLPYAPSILYNYVLWNKSVWANTDIMVPATIANPLDIVRYNDDLYAGWLTGAVTTSTAAAVNTVTSESKSGDSPKIVINGPTTPGTYCTLLWIENQTSKAVLYFNLDIYYGEGVTLSFVDGQVTVTSSTKGRIMSQPLVGSNSNKFRFQRGDNKLALFIVNTVTGVTASTLWNKTTDIIG